MSDSSASKGAKLDTDAHMQDASPSRPSVGAFVGRPPPRRRRRTINHPSTDGLFSSVLDFSTSAEDKRPSSALGVPIGQSANQQHMLHAGSALSLSSNFSGLDLGLASAFASISSPPSASSTLYQSPSAPAPKLDHGLGYIHVSESRASSSDPDVHMHDTDGEELRDLFSTMGLDGMYLVLLRESVPTSTICKVYRRIFSLTSCACPRQRMKSRNGRHRPYLPMPRVSRPTLAYARILRRQYHRVQGARSTYTAASEATPSEHPTPRVCQICLEEVLLI